MNRRDALLGLGGGVLGLLLDRRLARAQGPQPAAPKGRLTDLSRLDDLATRVRRASREEAFDVATAAIRAGATPATLIGAAFLVGVQEIRPRIVGSKLHAVMMVESAFQLLEKVPAGDAWTVALWTLDDCKVSQARDVAEHGDWTLPPRPEVSFASEAQARRELLAALESWDEARADRALVGLLAFRQPADIFELLWPAAARSYTNIGHKIIFAAQVERALRRIGSEHAEPALRSLVNGLLYQDSRGPRTESFDHARGRMQDLPPGWLAGKEDPEESLGLLRKLRGADPARSQDAVVEAFRAGIGPATVWDGLRLYATEIFQRRPASAARSHAPVHPVTEVNAFHHAWQTARDDTTRRLLILQAAAWLALLRDDLIGISGPMEGPEIDRMGDAAGEPPPLEAIFEAPATGAARARLDRDPVAAEAYLAGLRRFLMSRADQSHHYKYLAAVDEESAHVHPRWSSAILAPAVTYLPTPGDPETEVSRRTARALRAAGIAHA